MAYYDRKQFDCIEALRKELFQGNPDLVEHLSDGVPMLQTLGEICALLGIPVELTLDEEGLIQFIWTLVELLHKRATIIVGSADGAEIAAIGSALFHQQLLEEVVEEFNTGIIVTDDRIAVAPDLDDIKKEHTAADFVGFVDESGNPIEKGTVH